VSGGRRAGRRARRPTRRRRGRRAAPVRRGPRGRRRAYGDPLPGNDRYAIGLGDTDPADYVAEHLPGLDPRPVETRTCWVTELPWGHDALAVYELRALLFVAGNNLFKHALGHRLAAGAVDELRPEARLGRETDSANVNGAG
jgi:sarcosine oxidase